jgi:hypothetical protein
VAKRGRSTGSLGQLERQLADLNARRRRVIARIKATLERLSYGSAAPLAGLDLNPTVASARRGRAAATSGRRRHRGSSAVGGRPSGLAKPRKEAKRRVG